MALRSSIHRKPPVDRTFKVVRITGMYGTCNAIKAYIGNDEVGAAGFDAVAREWLVSFTARDGSNIETVIPAGADFRASMDKLEAYFAEAHATHYLPLAEVA
jgi:hypothetical protein